MSNQIVALLSVIAAIVCPFHSAAGRSNERLQSNLIAESLRQKLQQKVQFELKAEAPLEQLIEVAKTFQIPMGIEWNDSAECNAAPATFRIRESIGQLLNSIVRRCPAQRLTIDHGMAHVYSRLARHPRNILNLRVWRFPLKDGGVYDADHDLRLATDMQLHPAKYAWGYNGGYGYGPDHVFAIPNITLSNRHLRIRDALDDIVKASGNALWVARLNAATLHRRAPLSRIFKDYEALIGVWEFIPLKDTP